MPIPTLVHLLLTGLMVVCCVAAAVVAGRKAERWLSRHKLFALLGACSGLAGAVVMAAEKLEHGYPHFKSPHAILGLTVCILLVVVPAFGLLASRGAKALRVPHRLLARFLVVLAPLTFLSGLFRYLQLTKPASAPVLPVPPTSP